MNTTEMNELTVDRKDIKAYWQLPAVASVTNARKALGQPDWQNSKMSEEDATEVNDYFGLTLDKKLSPDDAILQIASSRNGRGDYCNEIDPDAIAKSSDAKRDETEDKGAAIEAIQQATQQGNVGLAEAGSHMAATNMEALKLGYVTTLIDKMSDFGNQLRDNLSSLSEAAASTPLDLREALLPTRQLSQPVESKRLQPHKETQKQISPGLW